MSAFLNVVMWAALGVGVLSLPAALLDRIGLSAVLIVASLGTATAVSAVEGDFVWSVVLGVMTLVVLVVYGRRVRFVRRHGQGGGAR